MNIDYGGWGGGGGYLVFPLVYTQTTASRPPPFSNEMKVRKVITMDRNCTGYCLCCAQFSFSSSLPVNNLLRIDPVIGSRFIPNDSQPIKMTTSEQIP